VSHNSCPGEKGQLRWKRKKDHYQIQGKRTGRLSQGSTREGSPFGKGAQKRGLVDKRKAFPEGE